MTDFVLRCDSKKVLIKKFGTGPSRLCRRAEAEPPAFR